MEKEINARQFAAITFMAGLAVKMVMLPSLLVAIAGRNAYVYMTIYMAVDLAVLGLIVVAVTKSKKSFYELLESVLGKIGARILLAVSIVLIAFKSTLMLGEVKVFFDESMYDRFLWPVYLIPLLALFGFAAVRSPRSIGRTAEITFPLIVLSIIGMFLLSAGKVDYANLLPFMRESSKGITDYFLGVGDFSVLTIFIGKTENKKHGKLLIMGLATAAALVVIAFTVILSAEFGNVRKLIEYGHNLGGQTEMSGSQNFGRLDLLLFAVLITSIFIQLMVHFYAMTEFTQYICNLWQPVARYSIAGGLMILVYVMCIFIFPTQAALYDVATSLTMRIIALPGQFLVPLTAFIGWIVQTVRSRRTYAQV